MIRTPPAFAFIIDTDLYAGNFEREMCAFITGQVGECGVGEEEAEEAREDLPSEMAKWFESHVDQVPDDHGCCRPCAIWETPGIFNDGCGTHWPEGTPIDIVRVPYEANTRKYYAPLISQAKAQGDAASVARFRKDMESLVARGPGHHPAYQSVAIFLNTRPDPEVLALMKDRAAKYDGGKYSEPGKILNLRLVKLSLTQEECL